MIKRSFLAIAAMALSHSLATEALEPARRTGPAKPYPKPPESKRDTPKVRDVPRYDGRSPNKRHRRV